MSNRIRNRNRIALFAVAVLALAACTSTVCPGLTSACATSACQAVSMASGTAAPDSNEIPSARGRTFAAGTFTSSA